MSTTLLDRVPKKIQRLIKPAPARGVEDLLDGAVAGAIGGIVGTLAMAAFQQVWMRATQGSGKSRSASGSTSGGTDEARNRLKNAGVGQGEFPQSEPRSHHQRISPSERLVATAYRNILHRPARPIERKVGGSAVHFAFGASVGALYGIAAEVAPEVTAGEGLPFGTAVLIVADEIALPLTGLAEAPWQTPARRHVYALFSHFAYGAATELTRRLLRDDD